MASVLGAFAGSVDALLVGRFFEGLGFIAVVVAIPTLVLRIARPADQRLAMTLVDVLHAGRRRLDDADRGGRPARHVVAHRLAGRRRRLGRSCSRRCCCAPCRATSSIPSRSTRRPVLHEMAEVASSGGPLAIALCFGAYSCCWFAVVGFLPTLQVERLGFSTSTAAIVTALVTIVNVGGNLAAGWLMQHGVPQGRPDRRGGGCRWRSAPPASSSTACPTCCGWCWPASIRP